MIGHRPALVCAALLAGPVCPLPGLAMEARSWDGLSVRPETPLSEAVMGRKPELWFHGESEHFTLHAKQANLLAGAANEAEFALARSVDYFPDLPGSGKAHLVLVPDEMGWERLLAVGGFRTDSLALYTENQIFVLRDENDRMGPLKIPAEVLHYQFHRVFGDGCPLWLEEGLTDYAGWEIARLYFRQRYHRILTRTRPALDPGALSGWDELTARTDYPSDPERARAFTRQINEMFRTIAERVGRDQVSVFMQKICREGKAWRVVLREDFRLDDADLAAMERGAASRVQREDSE